MNRGAICWVNLEDASPPEFGKIRPALVVSSTTQNEILDTVVIVPISSRGKEIWPLRLRLPTALAKESYAVLPGIRQVSKTRLLERLGQASPEFMRELDGALKAYLADEG